MKSSRTCSSVRCSGCGAAGFEQYEVSGYARAGRAARTTSTTGPLATTSALAPARTARFPMPRANWSCGPSSTREPRRYLAADPAALPKRPIAVRDLPFEFAMNGFRLVEGFEEQLFAAQHRSAHRRPGAGAGAAGGPRPGGTGARDLARNPRRVPISQRDTGRAAAGNRSRAGGLAQGALTLGGFMHRRPMRGAQIRGLRQVSVLLHDECHVSA